MFYQLSSELSRPFLGEMQGLQLQHLGQLFGGRNNKMITFYQWNKTFKTLDHTKFSPLSQQVQELMSKNDDLLINGYQKQSRKTCKKSTLKQRTQRTAKQTLRIEQDTHGNEQEEPPLKNLAIRERLNTLSPYKDSMMVKNSLIISKLHVKKCQMSFQKHVSKRVKEGLVKEDLACSARRNSRIMSDGKGKPMFSHPYSDRRSESMSEQKTIDKNKASSHRGPYNLNNKFKVLSQIIDKYKETIPQSSSHETLLSKFLKFQQKTEQKTISYEAMIRKKASKTQNIEEEPVYLSPSRRKSYRNNEETKKWGRYRRSTSNYKTSYTSQSNSHSHKKSLQSISFQWSQPKDPHQG